MVMDPIFFICIALLTTFTATTFTIATVKSIKTLPIYIGMVKFKIKLLLTHFFICSLKYFYDVILVKTSVSHLKCLYIRKTGQLYTLVIDHVSVCVYIVFVYTVIDLNYSLLLIDYFRVQYCR